MRIDAPQPPAPADRRAAAQALAAFESMLIARMLADAGVCGSGPDGALTRRAAADALAAGAPLGISRLLKDRIG